MIKTGYRSEHWTRGGTGVTNFGNSRLPLYEKAIEIIADQDLFLSDIPMYGGGQFMTDYASLHFSTRKDLSHFWEILDKLKAEQSAA